MEETTHQEYKVPSTQLGVGCFKKILGKAILKAVAVFN